MKGILVWGFPKCGTTSLLEYLKNKYNFPIAMQSGFYEKDFKDKISRREWCYLPFAEQMKRFKKIFGNIEDFQLAFITREPVERIWSGWEAWKHYYVGYTFEEYLQIETKEYNKKYPGLKGLSYLGEVNPIKQVDYEYWIEPFRKYKPLVFKLEEIRKEPGFPQTNSKKTVLVPRDKRMLIEKYLK